MGRDFVHDVRFGLRTLRRRPAFTITAILVLGLGIGAPTTVFSMVNRVLFERPAEVDEPHRILRLYRAWENGGGGSLAHADYVYYRDAASTVELAAYSGPGLIASYSVDGARSDQLSVERVSDNFFGVLGVEPVLGRDFLPEENATPGTHPVVVLGHGFWQRAFGGDSRVIGRTMTLNGTPYSVVGVLPEAYRGISPGSATADVWVPIVMSGALERADDPAWWERHPDYVSRWLNVVGRLEPGVSFEAAEANLQALFAALEYEGQDEDERLWVRREFLYSPSVASQLTGLSAILLGVVAIVLATAAANVAVLLLSRASARMREIGVRTAMGAGRGRISRQLVTESLVLGAGGVVVGVAIAYASSDLVASLLPLSIEGSFAPDLKVIGAAVALSLVTAIAVGLAPAFQVARLDLRGAVHDSAGRMGRNRLRGALVVGQLGLSLMLVAGALLFTRSFWAAHTQDIGFETEDRLVVRVRLQALGYDEARGRVFVHEALERIAALPGVLAVTTSRMMPFSGQWTSDIDAPPGATADAGERIRTGMNVVSPGYFDFMGMEIVRGRPLGEEDVEGAPPAIVINEKLAEATWPAEDPIGRTLPIREGMDFTVVGVAANANYYELGEDPYPQTWGSFDQVYQSTVGFFVHTAVPAPRLAEPVQDAIREIDPTIAFATVTTLEAATSDEVARYEVTAVLVSLFGAIALVLAAVGLYGVVSFAVSQRTREIGVRMALGADRRRVAGDVIKSGGRLAAIGLVLGLAGAVALRRFTASFLYQVEVADPVPLAGAALVLILVAVVASLAPARRATRVDPMEAIRAE